MNLRVTPAAATRAARPAAFPNADRQRRADQGARRSRQNVPPQRNVRPRRVPGRG